MQANADLLQTALTPAQRTLFQATIAEAERSDTAIWAVGGTVRDALMGRHPVDIDLAVSGDSVALASAVAARLPSAEVSAEGHFGTASLRWDGERVDLASLRSERYPAPGALPEVSWGAPIEQDLQRRDFTVNAMALALTGPRASQLLDPCGGLADLAAGRFAVLHGRSFEDDATRLVRAARLTVTRSLLPSCSTERTILESSGWLAPISGHRLWTEFSLIASRGHAGRTMTLLERWGVLRGVEAALALAPAARNALRHRWRPHPPERLLATLTAPLPRERALAVLDRLDAPATARSASEGARRLLAAARSAGTDAGTTPECLESLSRTTGEARRAALWLGSKEQQELQRELARWERTRPHLGSGQLLGLGVPPGPTLGLALATLRRARYLGTLKSAAEARALTRREWRRPRSQP